MFSLMFIFPKGVGENMVFFLLSVLLSSKEPKWKIRTVVSQVYLEIDTENRYCCSVVRLSF